LRQPIIEDKFEQVYTPKPMEEKELQQLMNYGKKFLQEIFEEGPICSIIP
jgi:hypothetical protein